jgi:hypothetical protein
MISFPPRVEPGRQVSGRNEIATRKGRSRVAEAKVTYGDLPQEAELRRSGRADYVLYAQNG